MLIPEELKPDDDQLDPETTKEDSEEVSSKEEGSEESEPSAEQRIPKSRFDEVIGQREREKAERERAEREANDLREQLIKNQEIITKLITGTAAPQADPVEEFVKPYLIELDPEEAAPNELLLAEKQNAFIREQAKELVASKRDREAREAAARSQAEQSAESQRVVAEYKAALAAIEVLHGVKLDIDSEEEKDIRKRVVDMAAKNPNLKSAGIAVSAAFQEMLVDANKGKTAAEIAAAKERLPGARRSPAPAPGTKPAAGTASIQDAVARAMAKTGIK
jgi:hypothetical protein